MNLVSFAGFVWRLNFIKRQDSCLYLICEKYYTLSYLYTPYPDIRNKFRSTRAHFTPQIPGKEQNEWWDGSAGLFSIKKEQTFSKLLYLGEDGIVMSHVGFGDPVYRVVNIEHNCITISDYGIGIAPWTPMDVWSNGYGKLLKQ